MILKIKQWCEGLIISIIISIIIEMLVPEGNNKKYVKVVIGIYIMFVVLNPILEMLNYQFDFDNLFNVEVQETYANSDTNIKDIYIIGIEETIKQDLENLGYIVKNVKVFTDINYDNIEKIEIQVEEKEEENIKIKPIIIGKNTNTQDDNECDYSKILDYFKENYFLDSDKIVFY